MTDDDLKSYGDALVGVDSHSLANDPLAKAINKMSKKDKEALAEMMCTAANVALDMLKRKALQKTE